MSKVVAALATASCIYSFIALSLGPLLFPKDTVTILYISNCFQLVFLPILLYNDKVGTKKLAAQQAKDHTELKRAIDEIQDIYNIEIKRSIKNDSSRRIGNPRTKKQ